MFSSSDNYYYSSPLNIFPIVFTSTNIIPLQFPLFIYLILIWRHSLLVGLQVIQTIVKKTNNIAITSPSTFNISITVYLQSYVLLSFRVLLTLVYKIKLSILFQKLPFGLIMSVMILPIVTVSIENAPEVNDTMVMTDFSVEPSNHLYIERLNGIVNDYIKWGVLK